MTDAHSFTLLSMSISSIFSLSDLSMNARESSDISLNPELLNTSYISIVNSISHEMMYHDTITMVNHVVKIWRTAKVKSMDVEDFYY